MSTIHKTGDYMIRTSVPARRAGLRSRLAALALLAGAFVLMAGSPALADETISINPGIVPATAGDFTQDCDPNLGGGPYPGEDVWVFNLPGNPQTTGRFLSVTATFDTQSGPFTRTIPTDPNSAIVNNMGTSKAWIRLPAGWTLTSATAVISGRANFFVVSHTCAASRSPVAPKLALSKSGSPSSGLQVGDKVTYTYTVKNESTGTAASITGIAVTDDKVKGIACQATSLAPGASTTCTGTYTVTAADVAAGKIVNSAQATGHFDERPVLSNDASFTVTTQEVQASLSIDKKARVESECKHECENDGYATQGDKIFYTYRVTNTGTVTITNVTVDDPTAGPVVCNSKTLAPGTSTDCHAVKPYVVTKSDVKKGKVVNTARATGKFGTKTVVSDPATVTICIRHGKFDHGKDGWDGKDLPVTGDSSVNTLALGGGLVAAGGALLGASRIRRRPLIHS